MSSAISFVMVRSMVFAVFTMFTVFAMLVFLVFVLSLLMVFVVGAVMMRPERWSDVDLGIDITSNGFEVDHSRDVELADHVTFDGLDIDVSGGDVLGETDCRGGN